VDVARAREEARGSQMEAKANPRAKAKAKARIQAQRGKAKARIPKGRARVKQRAQAKESPKDMMIMEVARVKEKGSLHLEDGMIMAVKARAKAKANRKGDTNHPGVVGTAGMIGHIPATTKVVKGRVKAGVTGEPLQRRPPL